MMVDRTKIWIAEKMKELMRDKPIEKIRITEICRLAGIERSTFYYHFVDKYDLVAWIFYHSAFQRDITSLEDAAKGLEQMKRDFIFYKRAYEDESQNPLWKYMLEYFVEQYNNIAKQRLHTDTLDVQTQFNIRHYCYGCIGMTREWLLNDNITPALRAVEMMFQSMPTSLHSIYFNY